MATAVAVSHPAQPCDRRPKTVYRRGTMTVPVLPKLQGHGKGPLVTTKLCGTIHKSKAGHIFDLSNPKEYSSFTEYNSLHDPHLKAYYYRPDLKRKLVANRFITKDLQVKCSLKEYNAYSNFLEIEFMKLRKREEEERELEKRKKTEQAVRQQHKRATDKEREEKRKQFFKQQEMKLRQKQFQLCKQKRREELTKLQMLEEQRMKRERTEIKREAEKEQRRLVKMQQEHEEALRRKKLLHHTENEDHIRIMHLQQLKQMERLQHLQSIDDRWQKYEDHLLQVKNEEEQRKARGQEEREKRMKRREKLFQILQKREDERRKKLVEENHHQVELLKEKADQLERYFKEKKTQDVSEWKEKVHRQQENWKQHLEHQKDEHRKETERHINDLLHTHVPACSSGTTDSYVRQSPRSHSYINSQRSSSNTGGSRPPMVRFTPTPTVHILEQTVWEEEDEEDRGVAEDEIEQTGNWERGTMSDDDATDIADQLEAAHPQEDGTHVQDVESSDDFATNTATDARHESELALEDMESDVEYEGNAVDPMETSTVTTSASTTAPEVSETAIVALSTEDLEQRQLASEIVKTAIGSAVSIRSAEENAATESDHEVVARETQPSTGEPSGDIDGTSQYDSAVEVNTNQD